MNAESAKSDRSGAARLMMGGLACIIGMVAAIHLMGSVWRMFRGGHGTAINVVSLLILLPALLAGLMLLISWWKELREQWWTVPAAFFALCTFLEGASLVDWTRYYQDAVGSRSFPAGFLLLVGVCGLASIFLLVLTAFVYRGTIALLHPIAPAGAIDRGLK